MSQWPTKDYRQRKSRKLSDTAKGYWLCKITAVNDDTTLVVSAYSELFSHKAEVTSENEKIPHTVEQVMPRDAPQKPMLCNTGIASHC